MGKSKVEKLWYKRWWAIVLFIFIGLVILGGLFGEDSSTSNNQILQDNLGSSNTEDFCKSLIPERIQLESYYVGDTEYWSNRDSDGKLLVNNTYLWNDGTPISSDTYGKPISRLSFGRGSRAGENVNLLYQGYVVYVNQNIKEDGTIGERITYRISMVLNPNDKTEEGYKVEQYRCCEGVCDIGAKKYNSL